MTTDLSGEAQVAAFTFNILILDQLRLLLKEHHHWFQGGWMGLEGQPFTCVTGLHDAAAKWLQPGPMNGETRELNLAFLEQFVEREWRSGSAAAS